MRKLWILSFITVGLIFCGYAKEATAKGNGLTARQTRAAKLIVKALIEMHYAARESRTPDEAQKRHIFAGREANKYLYILPNGEIKRAMKIAIDEYNHVFMSLLLSTSSDRSETTDSILSEIAMQSFKTATENTLYAADLVAGIATKRPPDNPLSPKIPSQMSPRERQRDEKIAKLRSALYDVAQTGTKRQDYITNLENVLISTTESAQKPDVTLVKKLAQDIAESFDQYIQDEKVLDILAKSIGMVMNSPKEKLADVHKAIKDLEDAGSFQGMYTDYGGQQVITDLKAIASNDSSIITEDAKLRRKLENFLNDLYKLRDQGELTLEERATLKNNLMALAIKEVKPNDGLVLKLVDDLIAMCGKIPGTESFDKLFPALFATMCSAYISKEKMDETIATAEKYTSIDRAYIYPVIKDMKAIVAETHRRNAGY